MVKIKEKINNKAYKNKIKMLEILQEERGHPL
jgi:hypothetical protein